MGCIQHDIIVWIRDKWIYKYMIILLLLGYRFHYLIIVRSASVWLNSIFRVVEYSFILNACIGFIHQQEITNSPFRKKNVIEHQKWFQQSKFGHMYYKSKGLKSVLWIPCKTSAFIIYKGTQ